MSARKWFLIYCKSRQEATAARNLEQQGYVVYLPRLRQPRKDRTAMRPGVVPMFPRYLFVHLDEQTDNWKPLRSTIGVSKLVMFGDRPACVPDEFVEALKSRSDPSGIHDPIAPPFVRGERVKIVGGTMAGYDAVFEAKSGRERVVLLLGFAGRLVPVRVSADSIVHAED